MRLNQSVNINEFYANLFTFSLGQNKSVSILQRLNCKSIIINNYVEGWKNEYRKIKNSNGAFPFLSPIGIC